MTMSDEMTVETGGRPRRRALLIGLDAADSGLLLSMIDRGELPNLARMRAEGAWGIVSSPPGFGSGAVWPSWATGVAPARHGRYYYTQVNPGSYEARRFEAEEFAAEPIWAPIAAAGRKVAVYDVPKVGLVEHDNVLQAADWIAHGPVYKGLRTWPGSYADDLVARYGADPLPKCDMPGGRDAAQMGEFVETMRGRIAQRERCTVDLLTAGEHDLIITVFAEPHCVGHQAWHVRDTGHPQHDAETLLAIGDPLAQAYVEIDAAIGRIADAAGDDTTVIVFSGTGMGPNYTGNQILDEVLRRLEGTQQTLRRSSTRRIKLIAKRVLPRSLRQRGRPMKRRIEESAAVGDRSRRRAFTVPHNDIAGAIRLNIAGREAEGILQPDDVDAYVEQLSEQLLRLRNADSGAPVVQRVVRTRDHMAGDAIDRMPDVFVLWHRDQPIDRVTSPEIGTVEYVHRGNRTGDHNPESCFFAVGPGVVPGETTDADLYDFAPTLAAIVGVDVDGTDGRVLPVLTASAPAGG